MPIALLGATDPSAVVSSVNGVISKVTETFDIGVIAPIIGVGVAAAGGLFLLWWGARKVTKMVMGAFTKGKLSIG